MNRDGVYYYIRRVPCDLSDFYAIKRLCFSLKTKSINTARRHSRSIEQKLEDYWLGLRLQSTETTKKLNPTKLNTDDTGIQKEQATPSPKDKRIDQVVEKKLKQVDTSISKFNTLIKAPSNVKTLGGLGLLSSNYSQT